VSRIKARQQQFIDPERGPVLTPRFIVSLVLMVVGIAWVVYYYVAVRPGPDDIDPKTLEPVYGGFGFMADLEKWNYVIGIGLFLLGLIIAAHPSTPLGRGRGVVVGMLGCFLVGLAWICLYYVMSGQSWEDNIPVLNDLGQYNLVVGISFMAVGFTFATRWE
jgi:drug/metabolite transporter (DMT)-like permease